MSHDYISMLNTWIKLGNQCDHDYFVVWPLANLYINDQSKNIHCLFSQNVNFRLNTLLHGALQLKVPLNICKTNICPVYRFYCTFQFKISYGFHYQQCLLYMYMYLYTLCILRDLYNCLPFQFIYSWLINLSYVEIARILFKYSCLTMVHTLVLNQNVFSE